ncbi:MAG: DUF2490 domain-containing protein [Paludibacteraceae bacterium]|nr:DUF2490 domain-containing protein [Paludibacteraceae bacterium]
MVRLFSHRILLLILGLLLLPDISFSQETEDFGTRIGASVSKRFWKKLEVGLGEELRFKNNSQDIDQWANEADISYTILKKVFKIGVGYDLKGEWNEYDEYFDFKHRFNGYFTLKHDISRVNISWKSCYQITYKNPDYGYYKWNPKNYWRNKINVSYNLPKIALEPYVSFESFYQMNNYKVNLFDRLRYEAGLEYAFDKHNSLTLSCRYNQAINVKERKNNCQVGLFYHYDF